MYNKNLSKYRPELADISKYNNFYEIINELSTFANKLSGELICHRNVSPHYDLGKIDELGLQINIGLKIKTKPTNVIVIRAYVLDKGFPLILNFANSEITIQNKEELIKQLYETIPNDKNIMSQLRGILIIANTHTLVF